MNNRKSKIVNHKNKLIVTPLGTVSPYPKDNKNCPGFLIESNKHKILLDCGEGITRLLNLPEDLNNLIIIISHLHKDHYSGLASIAYASYIYKNFGYLKEKIKVFIPKDEIRISLPSGVRLDTDYVDSKNIMDYEYLMDYGDENYLEFIPYDHETKILHGNLKISQAITKHPLKTYSIKIEAGNKSIVYSADTGFKNDELITFAKDCDLFICESTFLKGQSKGKDNHLYAYEAAEIAKKANAEKLLLTHFWPEIDKQLYVDEAKEIFANTEAAEEGKKLILRR